MRIARTVQLLYMFGGHHTGPEQLDLRTSSHNTHHIQQLGHTGPRHPQVVDLSKVFRKHSMHEGVQASTRVISLGFGILLRDLCNSIGTYAGSRQGFKKSIREPFIGIRTYRVKCRNP